MVTDYISGFPRIRHLQIFHRNVNKLYLRPKLEILTVDILCHVTFLRQQTGFPTFKVQYLDIDIIIQYQFNYEGRS